MPYTIRHGGRAPAPQSLQNMQQLYSQLLSINAARRQAQEQRQHQAAMQGSQQLFGAMQQRTGLDAAMERQKLVGQQRSEAGTAQAEAWGRRDRDQLARGLGFLDEASMIQAWEASGEPALDQWMLQRRQGMQTHEARNQWSLKTLGMPWQEVIADAERWGMTPQDYVAVRQGNHPYYTWDLTEDQQAQARRLQKARQQLEGAGWVGPGFDGLDVLSPDGQVTADGQAALQEIRRRQAAIRPGPVFRAKRTTATEQLKSTSALDPDGSGARWVQEFYESGMFKRMVRVAPDRYPAARNLSPPSMLNEQGRRTWMQQQANDSILWVDGPDGQRVPVAEKGGPFEVVKTSAAAEGLAMPQTGYAAMATPEQISHLEELLFSLKPSERQSLYKQAVDNLRSGQDDVEYEPPEPKVVRQEMLTILRTQLGLTSAPPTTGLGIDLTRASQGLRTEAQQWIAEARQTAEALTQKTTPLTPQERERLKDALQMLGGNVSPPRDARQPSYGAPASGPATGVLSGQPTVTTGQRPVPPVPQGPPRAEEIIVAKQTVDEISAKPRAKWAEGDEARLRAAIEVLERAQRHRPPTRDQGNKGSG